MMQKWLRMLKRKIEAYYDQKLALCYERHMKKTAGSRWERC